MKGRKEAAATQYKSCMTKQNERNEEEKKKETERVSNQYKGWNRVKGKSNTKRKKCGFLPVGTDRPEPFAREEKERTETAAVWAAPDT